MDFNINYKQQQFQVNNVTSYDDLIGEINSAFAYLKDHNLWYLDEEGDQIQVADTSDLLAITDPLSIVLNLEAAEDEEKKEEERLKKEQLKKAEENRQKIKKELIIKKRNLIQKEMDQCKEIEMDIIELNKKQKEELERLENMINQCENFKDETLPEFEKFLTQSNLTELVVEKEKSLVMLEGQKEFEIQLKTIQKEIHNCFEQLYSHRVSHFLYNYQKHHENKTQLQLLKVDLEDSKVRFQRENDLLNKKLKISKDKLEQYVKELDQLESQL